MDNSDVEKGGDGRHWLEGVSITGLLHSLDDGLVDAEGDGDAEEGEQQVGDHADDAERSQGEQQQHGQAERQPRLLGVPPVDEILHCGQWKTAFFFFFLVDNGCYVTNDAIILQQQKKKSMGQSSHLTDLIWSS